VAHPDYFMIGRRSWSMACDEAVHIIAKAAQDNHVALEINLNGIRYGKNTYDGKLAYPYPFRPFWEIVSQYNVQCLYSFDAHKPYTLLEKERIELVEDVLEGLNLSINHSYRI
jgi:histidinol-phosphatase (PHP family)